MRRPSRWQVRNNLLARTTLRILSTCEEIEEMRDVPFVASREERILVAHKQTTRPVNIRDSRYVEPCS